MNIFDYCNWRGDISFKNDPFNYVDGLIFAELSYYNFDNCFKSDKATIKELYSQYIKNNNVKDAKSTYNGEMLLKYLAKTSRFSDLYVYNYKSILDKESNEQFSALTIDLPGNTSIIAFRGTDFSTVGWYEDFQMSYKEVKAQIDAKEYLNNSNKLFKKYIVLGHSKGGNLALYAALNCKENIKNKIIKTISYDGPGIIGCSKLPENYIKIMPSNSIVGLIFDNNDDKLIIKSNGNTLEQHFIKNWQIISNKFENVDKLEDSALLYKIIIDSFINKTTNEDRKEFVDKLFEAIYENNIELFSNLDTSENIKVLISLLSKIISLNEKGKKAATILLKEIYDVYGNKFSKDINDFIENTKIQFKSILKKN